LKRLQGDLLTRLQRHQARTSELAFVQITFRNGEPLDYKGNAVPLPLAAFSEKCSLDATFDFDKLSLDGLKTSTRPNHFISGFSQGVHVREVLCLMGVRVLQSLARILPLLSSELHMSIVPTFADSHEASPSAIIHRHIRGVGGAETEVGPGNHRSACDGEGRHIFQHPHCDGESFSILIENARYVKVQDISKL
jgi:hypothetical protein